MGHLNAVLASFTTTPGRVPRIPACGRALPVPCLPIMHGTVDSGFLLAVAQCVRFIYAYMGFAGFSIFFFLTGAIALQLLEKAHARLDAFSFLFILYNFAARAPASLPCISAQSFSSCMTQRRCMRRLPVANQACLTSRMHAMQHAPPCIIGSLC